jgi:hypothetical protein
MRKIFWIKDLKSTVQEWPVEYPIFAFYLHTCHGKSCGKANGPLRLRWRAAGSLLGLAEGTAEPPCNAPSAHPMMVANAKSLYALSLSHLTESTTTSRTFVHRIPSFPSVLLD